jgi:hypothetical protein
MGVGWTWIPWSSGRWCADSALYHTSIRRMDYACHNPVISLDDICRHRHTEVQRLLREHGGRLDMDPVELGTLLCEAASTGDLHKIQVFIRADPNVVRDGG